MRDPFWRLKTLPWGVLLQNALLTVAIATVLDILLAQVLAFLVGTGTVGGRGGMAILNLLFAFLPFLVGFGIGTLSLRFMENIFSQVYLDVATLWGLVPCLALLLWLKDLIPVIPTFLAGLSYPTVVGIMVGIFVVGKRHWRY